MYKNFATVYDQFMHNVPYDKWVSYVKEIWKKYNLDPELVLDLGCGTGEISKRLSRDIEMIGVDNSIDMLMEARMKDPHTLYLEQDMRSFELYGTVDSILSLCDSMNYMTTKEDLQAVLDLSLNYLNPGGLFIFDMNTTYRFSTYGKNVFTENHEDATFIWENNYDEDSQINDYILTLFIHEKEDLFKKSVEYHTEKAYDIDTVKKLAEDTGFIFLDCFDEASFNPPHEKSKRVHYILQKPNE